MKTLLKVLTVVILLSSCQRKFSARDLEFTSLGALFSDQAATGLLKAERFEEALGLYFGMLEKEPHKPQIHSNIAVIMSQTQKPDDALKSWQYALKLAEEQKDATSLFAVNFNLGVYYGAQKKIADALKHYQAALDIIPTSMETKTNIELLIQSQQQGGKGESQNKDQNQSQDQNDQQNKDSQGKPKDDQKDKDQSGKDNQKNQDEKDKPGQEPPKAQSSGPYQPRPYQGEQLTEGDVKKILGELRNQEQKIRANFDKKEQKDSKNEKDW